MRFWKAPLERRAPPSVVPHGLGDDPVLDDRSNDSRAGTARDRASGLAAP